MRRLCEFLCAWAFIWDGQRATKQGREAISSSLSAFCGLSFQMKRLVRWGTKAEPQFTEVRYLWNQCFGPMKSYCYIPPRAPAPSRPTQPGLWIPSTRYSLRYLPTDYWRSHPLTGINLCKYYAPSLLEQRLSDDTDSPQYHHVSHLPKAMLDHHQHPNHWASSSDQTHTC